MQTRYLVFAGDHYYPGGGVTDFVSVHDDQTEAVSAIPSGKDWAHVAELSEHGLVIVAEIEDGWSDASVKLYPERMARRRNVTDLDAHRPDPGPTGDVTGG